MSNHPASVLYYVTACNVPLVTYLHAVTRVYEKHTRGETSIDQRMYYGEHCSESNMTSV